MAEKKILAFDLGAESGRGMLGRFDGQKLTLEVLHRFPNGGVATLDSLHWDVLFLYGEMLNCLRRCHDVGGIDSLGVDTWGVDFALLGRGNTLLGNPRHYRDPHTEGIMEYAFEKVGRSEIFRRTGLQFMRFNSLYQLVALKRAGSPLLDVAEHFLMIPDLFHFFFSGIKANELSNASTTQLYDPTQKLWSYELLRSFELPERILGTIVRPGTVLGPLRTSIAAETGMTSVPVIAPASHDTGSAIAAVPARGESWAYISSGTWSLMGAELAEPLINDQVQRFNFTNEGGVNATSRFLKNIMGLWLLQESRRAWERAGKSYSYEELVKAAAAATPFQCIVDPDDASFMLPPNMPEAIAEFCKKTGQPIPVEPGAVTRCILESLALRYRWVLECLEKLLGRRLDVIHIVGGGSQNHLLNQYTADACNRVVVAGPVEATAIGNVLIQAVGLRLLSSLADVREVVRRSFDVREFVPQRHDAWDEVYQRFLKFGAAR